LINQTIHSIRKQDDTNQLKKAADSLLIDYQSDKELTAFTSIDYEDFYETK
jgi:hypothetical protein